MTVPFACLILSQQEEKCKMIFVKYVKNIKLETIRCGNMNKTMERFYAIRQIKGVRQLRYINKKNIQKKYALKKK